MRVRTHCLRITVLLLLATTLLPTMALAAPPAQDGTVDPAVIAVIVAASQQVAQAAGVGTPAAPAAETPTDLTDAPVEGTEPVGEVIIPTEDDFAEYTSGGVSILAPVQWDVQTDSPDGIFSMADEAAELAVAMQDFGPSFPGLIVFPLFEANAQELVDSFATDAVISDISRVEIEQGLPVLRIAFSGGNDEGVQKGGVIYILATGGSALALLGGSSIETWPDLEPVVDAIARSILLDDNLITLQVAPDEGTVFSDDMIAAFTVPAGWYLSPVDDSEMRVIVGDPALAVVGALVAANDIAEDDPQLKAFADAVAGGMSDEDAQVVADEFVAAMNLGVADMVIDETMTAVLPAAGDALGTIRIVGSAPIEDGPMMDMSIYTTIFADKVAAMVFFGAPADVQAQEELILQMLGSTQME